MTITSSLDLEYISDPMALAKQLGYDGVPQVSAAALLATSPMGASPVHGYRHWLAVYRNGTSILKTLEFTTAGEAGLMCIAQMTVTLFAMFHDCRRRTEGECLEHGKAGALFLQSLQKQRHRQSKDLATIKKYDLQPEQMEAAIALAVYACDCHTLVGHPGDSLLLGEYATSPIPWINAGDFKLIVGTCLDADRLDLGRVGMRPNPYYLSTRAAQQACL